MLIPYLGEKYRFANFITPYIPKDISTYVEPFSGMYGVFFSLDHTKYKETKFIYNDMNKLNYSLFRSLKYSDSFFEMVKEKNVTKNVYLESLKNIFTDKSEDQLSLDWLIVLTCSNPHEIGKDSWIGNSEFDIFKYKYKAYKYHINKINEIHNLDYKEIIKLYDSNSSFFYIDPPYYGKEKFYLNHNFTENSHIELSEIVNSMKGRFILSYHWFDGLEDLYSICKIETIKTLMGTEYLIMNF